MATPYLVPIAATSPIIAGWCGPVLVQWRLGGPYAPGVWDGHRVLNEGPVAGLSLALDTRRPEVLDLLRRQPALGLQNRFEYPSFLPPMEDWVYSALVWGVCLRHTAGLHHTMSLENVSIPHQGGLRRPEQRLHLAGCVCTYQLDADHKGAFGWEMRNLGNNTVVRGPETGKAAIEQMFQEARNWGYALYVKSPRGKVKSPRGKVKLLLPKLGLDEPLPEPIYPPETEPL